MVGEKGLEPSQLALLVPKTSVSLRSVGFSIHTLSTMQHFVVNATPDATLFETSSAT